MPTVDMNQMPSRTRFICRGAVVVAEHRTRTLGDAADRQGEHLADGVDDRHHADIEIAAVDREHFVAGDLHQRVGEFHDEPHHAEAQNILQQIRTDMYLPDLQRQNRLRAGQEASTQMQLTAWLMTVATAAPVTPM